MNTKCHWMNLPFNERKKDVLGVKTKDSQNDEALKEEGCINITIVLDVSISEMGISKSY